MYKPLSIDVQAIARISSIKPLDVTDEFQRNSAFEAPTFVKGHLYNAKILEAAANGELKVSIAGRQHILAMQPQWKVGETLTLKYMGDESGISFQLVPHLDRQTAQVNLSPTAKDIAEQVNLAQRDGATHVYQAMIPATNTPQHVKQFAADLQHTLETTGLFYESHLADFAQGSRTLNSLLQEPQNQGGPVLQHLMAQQLNVLETQRVMWHGEIWPGQLADWQVQVEDQPQAETEIFQEPSVNSVLNLQLPHLGNIAANIRLVGHKLTVSLVAEDITASDIMKSNSAALIESFKSHAVKLKAISIVQGVSDE